MTTRSPKISYTIPCSSRFRDEMTALAARRGANVADLVRSVVLLLGPEVIAAFPDPGQPGPDDRETVILKSGRAKGRPWQRKPRLQVRLAPGFEVPFLRRALAVALALDRGKAVLHVEAPDHGLMPEPLVPAETDDRSDELERLRTVVAALRFDPLPSGVETRAEALHILGFAPGRRPNPEAVRARYRMLASIHHPDSGCGSHERMSQLNVAMEILGSGLT